MIAGADDVDRLPWLNDISTDTGVDPSWLPASFTKRRGIVILCVLVAGIAITALALLGRTVELLDRPSTQAGTLQTPADDVSPRENRQNHGLHDLPISERAAPVIKERIVLDDSRSHDEQDLHAVDALGEGLELQLGAYLTQVDAERGWDYLSHRFPLVQIFPKVIIPPNGEDDAFFRLRLKIPTEEKAEALCAHIQRDGEECFLVY